MYSSSLYFQQDVAHCSRYNTSRVTAVFGSQPLAFDGISQMHQRVEIVISGIPGQCMECVSPNGHFPSILFTEMDKSRKTFPENQLPN